VHASGFELGPPTTSAAALSTIRLKRVTLVASESTETWLLDFGSSEEVAMSRKETRPSSPFGRVELGREGES